MQHNTNYVAYGVEFCSDLSEVNAFMLEQSKENSDLKNVNESSNYYSYKLTIFNESGEMFELMLPKTSEGYFTFDDHFISSFLYVCAKNGKWVVSCRCPAFFRGRSIEDSFEVVLEKESLYKVTDGSREYMLLVEKVIPSRNIFHNFHFQSDVQFILGNQPECGIFYNGPLIAPEHALIYRTNGQWQIESLDEKYGIYVNKRRCSSAILELGDVVYIMGLKIIAGPSSLSINSGLGEVVVKPGLLSETVPLLNMRHYINHEAELNEDKYFERMPRKRRESEQKIIIVEGPPPTMSNKQVPLLLRLGGSMVMGGSAALSGNYVTLLSSVLFPFLSSKYTDAQKKEYEKLRTIKYTEYLEKKQQEISDAIDREQKELNIRYPSIKEISAMATSEHLWERRPVDSDFLQLRLGTGNQLLSAEIEYPERGFELESDELEEKMYQLVEQKYWVKNVPIRLSLTESFICGIKGEVNCVLEIIRNFVMQIAVCHSSDEVKMVFLLTKEELSVLDSVRYLPHVWDEFRNVRFVAIDKAQAYTVGDYIKNHILDNSDDKKEELSSILKSRPYYIVFALDKKIFDAHEVFKQILKKDYNCGVSIVAAFDGLPKECHKIIYLENNGKNTCTTMGVDGGDDENFTVENLNDKDFHKTMYMLSNINLKRSDKAQDMPKMVTFLEMFGVGRVEQLNALKRWRENNPVKTLAAPVGLGEDGTPFVLDLHEKQQGPHGLVAGMTGSGKSEFIISYILSMAVNYHPDEVSFVLIDYKGGGLADAFENPRTGVRLPHLAGTITNLDGASIQRSLMSIESELVRRQKVFSDVSKDFDEGSINIYTYQKLYRAGKVKEPMSHLFIISDEFAELKQQQPEFMEKLISAARIGRSLGVHLILATQKPSGVVNDQIRSNTKFRVCLRVQDRSDSMDMLKRPDAAELTDTGRFYLQVGYNEYFAMGQSAWCGADYEPQDVVTTKRDDAIEILDITGQVITKKAPEVKKLNFGKKQINEVVQYLANLASHYGIESVRLWTQELPRNIDLASLDCATFVNTKEMKVQLGMIDDPQQQRQFPLCIDFINCQNYLIVGNSGSGKTVLVQNILYSLCKLYSPEDFNFYVLDYSSRMLKIFNELPHCGAVLQEDDSDLLDNFFELINKIVLERKKLFSKLEVDNFELARQMQKLPLILVVIDNFSGLASSKIGEGHTYKMHGYLKNCANYGVKYIFTCNYINEINSRIRQEFGDRICLHVKDKYEYSDILGCKVTYVPPDLPGRGLIKFEGRPLEFHNAILYANLDEKMRIENLRSTLHAISKKYETNAGAKKLSIIREDIEFIDFAMQFEKKRVPLGFSKVNNKPIALPFKQFSALGLFFGNPLSVEPVLSNMIYEAKREAMLLFAVKRKNNSCLEQCIDTQFSDSNDFIKLFSLDDISMRELQSILVKEVSERNTLIQEYCAEIGIEGEPKAIYRQTFSMLCKKTRPIMLLIENFADFSMAIDSVNSIIYDRILQVAQRRNIYVVGCFEPDDDKRTNNKLLYSGFNQEKNVLLLGGQFDKQHLCVLPKTEGLDKILQFNMGLLCYQDRFHPIIMPCGELPQEEVDEDEQSIF